MFIRFFIVVALALAFILPMANYAKGLDFKDRPVFLRRIEERLAALFSGIFVSKEKIKQIDYGQNINHEPVDPPLPPQVGAKKQHSKPNYSLGPRILKQVWLADTKPKADAAIATESTPQLNLQPLLAIKENDVDTTQLEIEQVDAKPEPASETNPNTEPTQIAEQEQQPATQVAQSSPVQPEPPMLESTSGSEPSIQAQLVAQQTIALLEAYALQKQAE